MKKKNLNFLLALLAALALVFAFAGCADNGAGDGSTETPGTDEGNETPSQGCSCNTTDCESKPGCSACATDNCECDDCAAVTINMVYIGSFLRALTGQIAAYEDASVGWTLAGGTWSSSEVTYTLGTYGTGTSDSPNTDDILAAVKELDAQTSSDGILQIAFGDADWSNSTAPTGEDTSGSIIVTVTIAESANSNGYTVSTDSSDSALENFSTSGLAVTLVLPKEGVSTGNWVKYLTADQVGTLLQSITDTAVATTTGGTVYWLFASGSMSSETQTIDGVTGAFYVFSVADSSGTAASVQANASNTLANLQSAGNSGVVTAGGNPCKIDFNSAEWNGGAPASGNTGYLKVTVELADNYSGSYSVPSDLQTVYIEFTATNGSGWDS